MTSVFFLGGANTQARGNFQCCQNSFSLRKNMYMDDKRENKAKFNKKKIK